MSVLIPTRARREQAIASVLNRSRLMAGVPVVSRDCSKNTKAICDQESYEERIARDNAAVLAIRLKWEDAAIERQVAAQQVDEENFETLMGYMVAMEVAHMHYTPGF